MSKDISEGLQTMAKQARAHLGPHKHAVWNVSRRVCGAVGCVQQIPELKAFSCGADAGIDPERNHDFAIVADFADEAGYKAYATHPLHLDVIGRLIKPALAAGGRVAVQLEVAGGAL